MNKFLFLTFLTITILPLFFLLVILPAHAATATACIVTDIGKPNPNVTLPPECISLSGNAQQLARQVLILADQGKIILLNSSRQDIQAVVDGRLIQNSSSCNNAVTVHPELLKTMIYLGQRHTYTVWNIITQHDCDRFYHPKGRAMDIGSADGRNSWQNASFRQDAADILPDGGTLLQTYCPGTPPVVPKRRLIQGADGCNHQHIDVGISVP